MLVDKIVMIDFELICIKTIKLYFDILLNKVFYYIK